MIYNDIIIAAYDHYNEGCYSPKLLKIADIPLEVMSAFVHHCYQWCALIGRVNRRRHR